VRFTAEIPRGKGQAGMIELPFDVRAEYGQARPPVQGTVNGFRREIRDGAGIAPGDAVEIQLERDDAPRDVVVPDDLAEALAAETGLREAFDRMSFTHRREYAKAIDDAKRPETRARRVQLAVDAARERLAAG
jgi:hypothetical protein